MLDESIVQFHGRIRVHATKRVESKRNEVMAVPVTDLPVRPDVVVVEPLKGRHGASPSASSVLYTNRLVIYSYGTPYNTACRIYAYNTARIIRHAVLYAYNTRILSRGQPYTSSWFNNVFS